MTIASTTKKDNIKNSLILFTLGGKFFAIENSLIFQIISNPFINPVANTIPYFLGSTAFQGEVLAVIDLNQYLYEKDIGFQSDTSNNQQYFLVVEYKGQTLFFRVERVIGIIDKPDESLTRDIISNSEVKSKSFFKSAFMWETNIVVQLKIGMLFDQILLDTNMYFQNSNLPLQAPLSLPNDYTSLEEFNIELQHQIQRTAPISSWRTDRLIRPPKEGIYSGTVVSIQNMSILIPNENLVRIFTISQLTQIPNTSKIVVGAINYQGEVINAIDLCELLSENSKSENDKISSNHTRVLILEYENDKLALMMEEIPRIIEIQETDIRQTLILNKENYNNYLFQGVILEQSGNIILVLNIEYLFTKYFSSGSLEELHSQIISFYNPNSLATEEVQSSSQEGLLIQNDENLYFIDSEFVSQIVGREVFFMSDFSHAAIRGITTHHVLIPLVDFNFLVKGEQPSSNLTKKPVGVLLHDNKSGLEATFIVDNILGRVSIDQLDIFQPEASFYTKMLSQMISGFFSYQGNLGIIVKPTRLLEETYSIIKTDLGIKKVEDMVSRLLPEDKQSLAQLQDQDRERELYLSSHAEKDKLDYLVFQWGGVRLAIDVNVVQGVFSKSIEMVKAETTDHPILGTAILGEREYPILDLAALLMVASELVDFDNEIDFFSIKIEEEVYLIPVNNLEAVITTFKNDLFPSKRTDLFLKGEECSQYQFDIYKTSSSSVNIIKNEFLTKIITKRD